MQPPRSARLYELLLAAIIVVESGVIARAALAEASNPVVIRALPSGGRRVPIVVQHYAFLGVGCHSDVVIPFTTRRSSGTSFEEPTGFAAAAIPVTTHRIPSAACRIDGVAARTPPPQAPLRSGAAPVALATGGEKAIGSDSASSSTPLPHVAGLASLLTGCNFPPESLATGLAWFDGQGLCSLDQLREAEMEDELLAALGAKPGQAKLLRKRLINHGADDPIATTDATTDVQPRGGKRPRAPPTPPRR